MSKRTSLLLTILSVCLLSLNADGQKTNEVAQELSATFRQYNLLQAPTRESLRQLAQNGRLTIIANNQKFNLRLQPRDLLSPKYHAAETDANGLKETTVRPSVQNFKGTVDGASDSRVRLTVNDSIIEGFIFLADKQFYVEPAQHFSKSAAPEDLVIYEAKDIINPTALSCGLEEKIEKAANTYLSPDISPSATSTFKVAEIATEADFDFFTQHGSSVANSNQDALHILNMVEGVYEQQAGLTFSVTFQHVWTTPDPYPASLSSALPAFRDYWNANFPVAQYQRDTAHFFTGKAAVFGQGLSYIGVICSNPAFAYGISSYLNSEPAQFLLTAHEIGHNFNAAHVDATQSCASTIMNAQLSYNTPFTFCQYSRDQIGTFASNNGSCLTIRSASATKYDYDGDGKSDISVFRPSTGTWYISRSGTGALAASQFGTLGDRPAPADFDGDGITDYAVFRPSTGIWYILNSSNNSFTAVQFGTVGDLPDPADFSGDGKAELAVFRPSNGVWYIDNLTKGAFNAAPFGTNGDTPVAGDYDGDGKADLAVFRQSSGMWYEMRSSQGFFATQFGAAGDSAAPADFDGDGKTDVAVFRPSSGIWYAWQSANSSLKAVAFGMGSDVPVVADYDGDGKADVAVFRPSTGIWYRLNSGSNGFNAVQFGASGDIAVPGAFQLLVP